MGRSGGHAPVSQRPGGSPLSACPRGTCRGHLRVSTGHYGAGHHGRGRSHHVPDLFAGGVLHAHHPGATPWRLSEVLGIGLWRRNEYEEDNVVQPGRRGAATDWRGNRT